MEFNDKSKVEFASRESVRYSEGQFTKEIWVVGEKGIFTNTRIIMAKSIEFWDEVPKGEKKEISSCMKWKILARVLEYFSQKGCKCRVEEVLEDFR